MEDIELALSLGWVEVAAWRCDRCNNDRIWSDKPGSLWSRKHWRSPMGFMNDGSDTCFISPDLRSAKHQMLLDELSTAYERIRVLEAGEGS